VTRTQLIGNAVGYQAVWFAAVIGAGRGLWWPAVAAAGVFVATQLALSDRRAAELKLVGAALLTGVLLDGTLAFSGLARFAADGVALPPGGAPVWILAIWAAFAVTLRHSMGFMMERPVAAMLLGAIGGPLAYAAAGRGFAAVSFPQMTQAMLVLAVGWALAMPGLARLAARLGRTTVAPAKAGNRSKR
jgi:hypothetical protein